MTTLKAAQDAHFDKIFCPPIPNGINGWAQLIIDLASKLAEDDIT
jgi:hypothetical protein